MLHAKPRPYVEGDPRADYTRSLVNLVRIGDIAGELAPQEVFEALCEAVWKPLDLDVVVVIDTVEKRPRLLSWKGSNAGSYDVEHAEYRAWSCFATLVQTDWLPGLLTSTQPRGVSTLHWTVQPLSTPPRGVIELGTRRPLEHVDYGLIKCMGMRLASAFRQPVAEPCSSKTG
jgi:hypothetical protein